MAKKKKKKTQQQKNPIMKCCSGCRETGSLIDCWWEYKMVQQQWKIVWHFLKQYYHTMQLPFNRAFVFRAFITR